MRWTRVALVAAFACAGITFGPSPVLSQPATVLLTNDNGIEDPKLRALASAFAEVAETWVVAPAVDRSGGSNFAPATRERTYRVEAVDLGPGIRAFALHGYPADCVIFALTGPLAETPPDLVVSGINGGPNLADDWFGSGTIGAARTAAYFGVRAIAVSGLQSEDPVSMAAAAGWVVRLAASDPVRRMESPEYLTVSFPPIDLTEVEGVAVVDRARGVVGGEAARTGRTGNGGQVWELEVTIRSEAPPGTDLEAVAGNRIAIVPMRVDEGDPEGKRHLTGAVGAIPTWSFSRPEGSCTPRVGVVIDDAEDETGREWGVLVEEVQPDGPADQAGLRAGDVIVALNGESLESGRGEPDPDDKLVRRLRQIGCDGVAVFDVRRDGSGVEVRMELAGP